MFQIDDKLDLVMNGTEDLLFNLFCGDAVRAARPAVLIGGADVVDILFVFDGTVLRIIGC